MEDDEEAQPHPSPETGSPSSPQSNGRITVTVAAAPPQNTLTLALPIQHPRSSVIVNNGGSGGGGREDCWSEERRHRCMGRAVLGTEQRESEAEALEVEKITRRSLKRIFSARTVLIWWRNRRSPAVVGQARGHFSFGTVIKLRRNRRSHPQIHSVEEMEEVMVRWERVRGNFGRSL